MTEAATPPDEAALYLGIMSGTSLDGIDVALADFSGLAPRLTAHHFRPYSTEIREALLALHEVGGNEIHHAALMANRLTEEYALAVNDLVKAYGASTAKEEKSLPIAALGCHGQTIRHHPEEGYTVQLVNGALLAERTGITTVVDFRSRDIAAGGQGAPLVPAFHAACFRDAAINRAIVNIGGIANVTCLPATGAVTGFDTGPGNMLMDAWAMRHLGKPIDHDGAYAASGAVDERFLDRLLAQPYFHAAPPKSTGRDLFNMTWLESLGVDAIAPVNVQASLCELTARTIAGALTRWCPGTTEVFVCGGGAHNGHLMRRLAAHLPGRRLDSTAVLGVDPDWMEAMAFAWLARRALKGLPGNMPEVTGAKGPRVLGAIYPA